MEAREERIGTTELMTLLDEQARQISELRDALKEMGGRRRGGSAEEGHGELGYRFDSYPKWLEASGWKDQGPKHRRAWPLLRRFLELERWPGAHVRFTLDQLADHLCCSRDTARRRLRELEGLGVMTHKPGRGRDVSTVRISHPIATPLSYSEVPWALGGLAGAPDGYAENLSDAKRHYARLYGADLSAVPQESIPAQESDNSTEASVGSSTSRVADVRRGDPVGPKLEEVGEPARQGGQEATPGGANCYPLETIETKAFNHPSSRSDEDGRKKEKERRLIKEMEQKAKRVPPELVTEGSIEDARCMLEAVGKQDPELAVRAAQLAQLLADDGERQTLQKALIRVRRSARYTEIVHPVRYVLATVLDVRGETEAGADEIELGRSILRGASASQNEQDRHGGGELGGSKRRRRRRSITEGYEWLFEAPWGREKPLRHEDENEEHEEDQERLRRTSKWWLGAEQGDLEGGAL